MSFRILESSSSAAGNPGRSQSIALELNWYFNGSVAFQQPFEAIQD